MAVSKIQKSNGDVLIDLTSDTVTPSALMTGYTAHDKTGALITGTASGGGGDGYVWQDAEGYIHLSDEEGTSISVEPLSVTQNGTYTAPTGKAYSPVTVNVDGGTPTPTPSKKWVRPSDWPDLSKMDISGGDVVYMTSYADEARGFCSFYVACTGNYTVEVGSISGSTFTPESTHTYSNGSYCTLQYGSLNDAYKVLRVTGTAINKFSFLSSSAIGDLYSYSSNQGIIDVVGKLPSCTYINFGYIYNLINVEIKGLALTSCSSAFINCYSLKHIDASDWNTSNVTNMSSMFNYCYSLTSIDVSGFDTSSVTNMSSMFNYCCSLTSIDVSDWNTSSVTDMSSMFSNCRSLTSIDVSGFDTSSVTSLSNMFTSCNSLTSIDVSGFDTSSVKNMSSMFNNCYSLTSIDVSGFDTSSVTNMSSMFNYCCSLTSIDVSGFDTSSVTNMSSMFNNCCSLTSIDVSGWDFTKVITAASSAQIFYQCFGLHGSITIPSTMTMIGSNCFYQCRNLYEWHFLATNPPTLSSTNAFSNMTDFGGKKIYVPAASLEAYKTAANWSTYASYIEGE